MFFIVLHLNYKKMPYILWFAFMAITISIRITAFYPHIISHIWPSIPWKLFFILRYATIPLAALFFTVFIRNIFNIRQRFFYWTLIASSIIATIFIIIAPTLLVSRYLPLQQAIVFLAVTYNTVVIIKAFIQRQRYALWIAVILCCLEIFAIHDMLVSQWVISDKLLLQEGAVIAIIIAVVMSINGYAKAIQQIEQLVEEQKEIGFTDIKR